MGAKTDPCRIMCHPSYAGVVLSCFASPFMLDAVKRPIPAVLMAAVTLIRWI